VSAETPEPLSGRHILVVDDEPTVRQVLEEALTRAGAQAWMADGGNQALALLQRGLPDLVLLDLAMPQMDGWRVLEILRESPRTARLPVVLETSSEDYPSFDRARRQGVAAFVSKPFRLSELIETCRRVLEGARPLQGRPDTHERLQAVAVFDAEGRALGDGRLVDLAPRGARVSLAIPLGVGQVIQLVLEPNARRQVAEVRWVKQVEGAFDHGVALRDA
jgi:CheY-like chemotaxis protein